MAGGYIAYMMGIPIKFLAAVNENDVVHFHFQKLSSKDMPLPWTSRSPTTSRGSSTLCRVAAVKQ